MNTMNPPPPTSAERIQHLEAQVTELTKLISGLMTRTEGDGSKQVLQAVLAGESGRLARMMMERMRRLERIAVATAAYIKKAVAVKKGEAQASEIDGIVAEMVAAMKDFAQWQETNKAFLGGDGTPT